MLQRRTASNICEYYFIIYMTSAHVHVCRADENKKCTLGCVLTLSMMMPTFVWVIPMKVHLMSSELKVMEKRYYMYIIVKWWRWGGGAQVQITNADREIVIQKIEFVDEWWGVEKNGK